MVQPSKSPLKPCQSILVNPPRFQQSQLHSSHHDSFIVVTRALLPTDKILSNPSLFTLEYKQPKHLDPSTDLTFQPPPQPHLSEVYLFIQSFIFIVCTFVFVWGSIRNLWRSDPLVLQVVASLETELKSSVRAICS